MTKHLDMIEETMRWLNKQTRAVLRRPLSAHQAVILRELRGRAQQLQRDLDRLIKQ